MTATDTLRSVVTHRGMSCLELHRKLGEMARQIARLTPRAQQATAMEARLDEQALTIVSLRQQLAQAKQIRDDQNAKAARYKDAEDRAQAAEQLMAEQQAELISLRQFKANVTSVSTLPPAGPAAPPADRFETGSPVRLGASPVATTNPGRVPPSWAREDDTVRTQEIPVITPVEPAT